MISLLTEKIVLQKVCKTRQDDEQEQIKKPKKLSEERDYSALRQCCSPESEDVEITKTN
jgi:hypothetical protein